MLGEVKGKKILDLGCGEGYNTRLLAGMGVDVVGVDFSEEMIKLAITEEENQQQGIEYHVADACELHMFEDGSFDIVTAFLAIQDIEDYQKAINEAARVLKTDDRFVFSITHPCFEIRMTGDKILCGWVYENDDEKSIDEKVLYSIPEEPPKHFAVDQYFKRTMDTVPWTMDRLSKHFETTAFHRTLADYVTALSNAGLLVSNMDEPVPTEKGIEIHPVMKENCRIPHSLIVETIKK